MCVCVRERERGGGGGGRGADRPAGRQTDCRRLRVQGEFTNIREANLYSMNRLFCSLFVCLLLFVFWLLYLVFVGGWGEGRSGVALLGRRANLLFDNS